MEEVSGTHPWADHLNIRTDFKINWDFEHNDTDPAPHKFNDATLIRPPGESRALTARECVTLDDVIYFRDETTILRQNYKKPVDDSCLPLERFRVIYRYAELIQTGDETLPILEAIHFEIFRPDRPDLRFIALPIELLPEDSCEGDYFEVHSVIYSPDIFIKHHERGFWIQWTVTQFDRMDHGPLLVDYILVTEKMDEKSQDRKAVCNWTTNYIGARQRRFIKTDSDKNMKENQIYDANILDTSSAWIYPVEPPKDREEYAKLVEDNRTVLFFAGTFAQRISVLRKPDQARIDDRLGDFNEFSRDMKMAEQHMIRLFQLGVRFRQLATPKLREMAYVMNFDPPKLQVCTDKFFLDSITLHFDEKSFKLSVDNIKRECDGRRKKTFIYCQSNPDFTKKMGSREAGFWMEATLHGSGESATHRILEKIEKEQVEMESGVEKERYLIGKEIPKIIQAVYGQDDVKESYPTASSYTVERRNGQLLKLNEQQTKAMEIYHKIENSGYCILSPPGSGKTTVAAAMAASLVKDRQANRQGSVQLLLAVQNVAVENLATALKSFDDGSLKAYRLLSRPRTDPNDPLPYGIFEQFPNWKRWMVDAEDHELNDMEFFFNVEAEWRKIQEHSTIVSEEQMNENQTLFTETLFNAKAIMERYMKPEIILSTVDLVLFRMLIGAERGVRGQMWDVDRIIIDEASLLTEAAFYCLARCFPKASFVLIGDDKQLPPFMYDGKVLGHQIAGKAALSVAMRRENMHIIKLVEVYRAPQSLVQPYNNLSYDGTLVSRKKESSHPLLFQVGLVPRNKPDLLLVDIPKGHETGYPSMYNEMEMDVLLRLLNLIPKSTHDDIMIICLYKEQRTRVQRTLGPEYDVITVDSSQGKEKPIVIVLTTRTEKANEYFCDPHRCTVAVSRHQQALIILGNNHLLSTRLPWSKVLEDFTRIQPAQIPEPRRSPWHVTPQESIPDLQLDLSDFPTLNSSVSVSKQPSATPNLSVSSTNPRSNAKRSPVPGNGVSSSNISPNPHSSVSHTRPSTNSHRMPPTVSGSQVYPSFPPHAPMWNGFGRPPPPFPNAQMMPPNMPFPPYPFPPYPNPNISRFFPNGVPRSGGWY